MTLEQINRYVLTPGLAALPTPMDTPAARAMLLAIGQQESQFVARKQEPAGPARGFWQFEPGGGVMGVLQHPHTKDMALRLCGTWHVRTNVLDLWGAIMYHDPLAAGFARLLLWTLPDALPGPHDAARGWAQYLDAWRPGKPRVEKWERNYAAAWRAVGIVSPIVIASATTPPQIPARTPETV